MTELARSRRCTAPPDTALPGPRADPASALRGPGGWPRTAVVGALAGLAVVLGLMELLAPAWTGHGGPLVLAAATWVVGALVVDHCRWIDPVAAQAWRALAVIAGLLGLGQAGRGLVGVGVNPDVSGLSDLPLAAAGLVTVLLCARLVRATGGRVRARVVLDATVALVAIGVLMEVVVPAAVGISDAAADPLLTVGYPAVSAVLCAAGLVTLAGVRAARRAAAGWLLLAFGSLAVAMLSGALAVASPSPALDVVSSTAYLAMLVAATLALAADPGPRAGGAPAAAVPLAGIVVSYCLAFGVVLLLLGGWATVRSVTSGEAAVLTVLLLLTFVRTLVWAGDSARLTRHVLRTEAYFRTLVNSSADITIVLDHHGQITWSSGAEHGPTAWAARDLEGHRLQEFVHADDRAELERALAATGVHDGPGRVFRLRTRDGGWRAYETVRVVSSAALQAGPSGRDADGLILHLRELDGRRVDERELERLAYTDYLTGLPNRARLMAAAAAARSRAAEGDAACLLLLDLDGFKAVNDIAGHEAGDLLLVEVAARLRTTVRDRDLVGRLGGDEFAVLVSADLEEASALAERIVVELHGVHRSVPTPGADPDLVFDVSASIGVTALDPAEDVPVAFRQADLALRAAKAAGKDCVRRHGEAADSATGRRTRLARDLPDALDRGQLRLVYQPVVGLAERRVLGLEALLRWDHPLLGEVPPEEFIPLAEDDGLIVPMQRWVLDQATAELAGLLRQGRDLQLGVNISVRHLQAGCLVPDVAAALGPAGLPPRRLMLEVTESVFIGERDRAEGDLSTLHDMGCVISLDDFGRGYSTFAYLARLPVDVLKMDREFLAGIEDDERSAALVGSVIDLGRRLDIDVVAEGVETRGQLAALSGLGCRYLQGFLLGRPTAAAELPALIDGFDAALLDGPLALN
ncbi:PAS domain S-box-containing protein/diguanylate cyclase (GGDEF) domain-containing protein [Modestobacter sp. DSM 44400]|uniref:putative bifunctional diguanylate cyclase/phosphodiesterase n=1 Tax=Modestobacter sp. DSM 44400 TaxID=1550230 RepID=UPI00089BFE01|nr:bifunctional diguanylate cyclase/phosphodiesterase [Modestobacter sp. DSM 44400]SDX66979.1 PAS domain S-box-containing protein/diguanylate cyclase (GGDEF) domain-containing protein [Modestobacter sp. DSM 44400]